MSSNERNFSNFHLGDNVYELADGVIPDIAERLDVALAQEPNSSDLQLLMDKVGTNKVLRNNREVMAMSRKTKVALVNRSQIQARLGRSLWTPDIPVTDSTVDAIVTQGGVANWQDRTARAIGEYKGIPVYSVTGNRVMDTATEVVNDNVISLEKNFKRYPTEAEYAGSIVVPQLVSSGHVVLDISYPTKSGDEMFDRMFEDNPHLLDERLAMARVANAGIVMAIQLREAARKITPGFDTDPNDPQVFIITDKAPVARTKDQEGNAVRYQKSDTAIRQLVLTAKKLHEAADK
ncbi:MAG TPA: hypothetical protein VLF88_01000 [Candidatus Babeliales bacterium]|nr:hypothetical protein [Candidatus Babeliales bacterium]